MEIINFLKSQGAIIIKNIFGLLPEDVLNKRKKVVHFNLTEEDNTEASELNNIESDIEEITIKEKTEDELEKEMAFEEAPNYSVQRIYSFSLPDPLYGVK